MAIDQVQNLIPLRKTSHYLRFLNSIKLPRVQTYSNLLLQAYGHLPPFKIRSNKYLQSKEEQRWGFDREGNTEELGQGTVDSPRTRIRRKNSHHKRKSSHLSALPQRQERNNLLLQRRSRHNPQQQNSNAKRRRRRNPAPENSSQNYRKKEFNPV